MKNKVLRLLSRFEALEEKLGHPDVFNDQKQYRTLTQEHSYLSNIKAAWETLEGARKTLAESVEMLKVEEDPEFIEVLREEVEKSEKLIEKKQALIENLLVPPDPNDSKNTIMELRAGTGGDEAALFVGDCVRMYKMYAEKMGWKYEQLSCTPAEVGGYKEYVMVLTGPNVYRYLKHEGGTHRVQRVPDTEAQGRVHTSAITVAALVEPDADSDVEIDDKDVRLDTFRSSGAGGQHVNTTDSAVRLTHIPTGIVVECQAERSQHKNREKAMRHLKAKILEDQIRKKNEEIASTRATQVGTGDRSGKVRTYNYPQNRVTDHRVNLTRHNLDLIMEGQLEEFSNALIANQHQEKLSE